MYFHNLSIENSIWTPVKLRCIFFSSTLVLFQSISSSWINIILNFYHVDYFICLLVLLCCCAEYWTYDPVYLWYNFEILQNVQNLASVLYFSHSYAAHLFEWRHHSVLILFLINDWVISNFELLQKKLLCPLWHIFGGSVSMSSFSLVISPDGKI